ncbi:MAG: carboxypeptidase-like regulatory domain-containing protein, partial [Bacteroidota bacterium]|nr:carboxypeptidase-like regulatory domain-containing protein [Bacteroidota bacterium]
MLIRTGNSIKERWLYCMLFPLFLFATISNAQTIVTGKIIDATSRQPLAAASITEEGYQKHSAITDQDGNFLIRVSSLNSVLVASFIGFEA